MENNKPAYLVASAFFPAGHASLAEYGQACHPIFQAYGAEALVIGNVDQEIDLLEGSWPDKNAKLSLIKFPSMQHLKNCLNSDEYLAIKHLRTDHIASNFTIAIS